MIGTWFTSDLHFCHNKPFVYEPRGFSSIYEMNETIVANWNEVVDSEDDVYVLGDLMLVDNEAGAKYIKSLKGKLHIILGNHDTDNRIELYNDFYNVVEITYAKILKIGGLRFFLCHYPVLCGNYDDNEKPLNRRLISLCGHTHTKDPFADWSKGNIYHVELDAHNNELVSFEEIKEDLVSRAK